MQNRITNTVQRQAGVAYHLRVIADNGLIRQTFFSFPWLALGIMYAWLVHEQTFWYYCSFSTVTALIVSFVSARLSGMSWNRLIDAAIDGKNRRTKDRALPSGKARDIEVAFHALFFLGLFLFATRYLTRSCQVIAIPLGFMLIAYSFLKRFTALCHAALGFVYFTVPLAAAFAFGAPVSLQLMLLGLAALAVVMGSDIIYSCQDAFFDRRFKLRSIPADYGIDFSVKFAAACHIVAAVCVGTVLSDMHVNHLSWLIYVVGLSALMLKWKQIFSEEHAVGISQHFASLLNLFGFTIFLPFAVEGLWRGLS